jgi:hypothetical protein
LASYIAVSAFLKRISAVSPSSGYMAIPILLVMEKTVPLNSQGSAIELSGQRIIENYYPNPCTCFI